jgi:hypothetical protein
VFKRDMINYFLFPCVLLKIPFHCSLTQSRYFTTVETTKSCENISPGYHICVSMHQLSLVHLSCSKETAVRVFQFDNATSYVIDGSTTLPIPPCTRCENLCKFLRIPLHFMTFRRQRSHVFFNHSDNFIRTNNMCKAYHELFSKRKQHF